MVLDATSGRTVWSRGAGCKRDAGGEGREERGGGSELVVSTVGGGREASWSRNSEASGLVGDIFARGLQARQAGKAGVAGNRLRRWIQLQRPFSGHHWSRAPPRGTASVLVQSGHLHNTASNIQQVANVIHCAKSRGQKNSPSRGRCPLSSPTECPFGSGLP